MITIIAKKQKVSLENQIKILSKVKKELKTNLIAKEICDEYDFEIDIVDGIPIDFKEDLEASAKTVDGRIFLSANLIDEEFEIIMRYAIHELVHSLQHMKNKKREDKYKDADYLDRGDELEAFQYQIKFDKKERGVEEAKEYVDELVEYHELPKEKANQKKKELLEKAI